MCLHNHRESEGSVQNMSLRERQARLRALKRALITPITPITLCALIGLICGPHVALNHAYGDVGTPCAELADCEPGEVCAPGRVEGDPSFCTRACFDGDPCPEGYECTSYGGAALCNTELVLGDLGEPCEPGCKEGLLCLDDGVERYCSVSCTLPGSCPEGYRCVSGELSGCARVTSAASAGSPCSEELMCAEGLECASLPHRALSYCTYGCEERACPDGMTCEGEGEGARCVHPPYERGIGETCVSEAVDSALIGCAAGLSCEPSDVGASTCVQSCDRDTPCPEGFGCQRDPSDDPLSESGQCAPGAPSDSGLEPRVEPRVEPEESGGSMTGDQGGASSPDSDQAGDSGAVSSANETSVGCDQRSLNTSPSTPAILIIALLGLLSRLNLLRLSRDLAHKTLRVAHQGSLIDRRAR